MLEDARRRKEELDQAAFDEVDEDEGEDRDDWSA
jgi:hypothetical protein